MKVEAIYTEGKRPPAQLLKKIQSLQTPVLKKLLTEESFGIDGDCRYVASALMDDLYNSNVGGDLRYVRGIDKKGTRGRPANWEHFWVELDGWVLDASNSLQPPDWRANGRKIIVLPSKYYYKFMRMTVTSKKKPEQFNTSLKEKRKKGEDEEIKTQYMQIKDDEILPMKFLEKLQRATDFPRLKAGLLELEEMRYTEGNCRDVTACVMHDLHKSLGDSGLRHVIGVAKEGKDGKPLNIKHHWVELNGWVIDASNAVANNHQNNINVFNRQNYYDHYNITVVRKRNHKQFIKYIRKIRKQLNKKEN